MGLLITLALGCFIVMGAFIHHLTRNNQVIVQISVAIALGTLGTLAVIELVPESMEYLEGKWLLLAAGIIIGIGLLLVLERFLPDHGEHNHGHGHGHKHSHHDKEGSPTCERNGVHVHGHGHNDHDAAHIGIISAIAITLHNIIEGMAVYSVTDQSLMSGVMMALGVGLHNIPMGMVIAATLQGKKREQTVMLVIASISTFAGGVVMALLWSVIGDIVIGFLLALTLGMIVYIVCFELIPMIIVQKRWELSIPGILLGVAIIVISTLME